MIWCGAIFLMTIGSYAILMFEKDEAYILQKSNRLGELVRRKVRAAPASGASSAAPADLASAPARASASSH